MNEAGCLEFCVVGFKSSRMLEICGDKRSFTDGVVQLQAAWDKRFKEHASWV